MMRVVSLLSVWLGACHTQAIGDRERRREAELLDVVRNLAGEWRTADGRRTRFDVTSGGTAVRETMFPGEADEMVNMYCGDQGALVLTHYCSGGNQPRMVARAWDGSRLRFGPDGVGGLDRPGQQYMGEMTLVIDGDRLEQHWRMHPRGESPAEMHDVVLRFTRSR
jgi:hypothetical protein